MTAHFQAGTEILGEATVPAPLTAPLPASVAFVTFPSRTVTTPTAGADPWPRLAERLTQHARRAGKDGPGWSPAAYKRDKGGALLTRLNTSVEALTCAVADVDHVELDDVAQLRDHVRDQGLAGALYSTHSSTETAPRIRVVVPFAEPVPAELWPRLWPALNERLFLGLADRAACDPSRLYYLPAAPPDVAVLAESWAGAALDWRALPLADPETVATAEVVAIRGTGPAETVDPADMPILERLFSGPRGEVRMRAWSGDYADFGGNASSADQSLANGVVTYCRGDVARAERIMRAAGAYRPKWDERRGATTWLGVTLGKALAAYRAWAGRQEPASEPEPAPPADETCEQKVARLKRTLAERDRELAQAQAVRAAQETIIRAQRATIERQNREKYAQYRLRRSKLKAAQVDAVVSIATLASKRAEYHQTDAPIITAKQLGEEMGMHESSARSNAEAVCNLPGSPIRRVSEYRQDGKYGQLTTYKLDVRDPVEVLERFVTVAEALDTRQATRPRRLRCPVHPDAGTMTICDAPECSVIFSRRPGEPEPTPEPLCVEVTRIETEPPTVDVPVLTHVRHARIEPDGLDEVTLARRAREAVETQARAPGPSKPPGHAMHESRAGESIGPIKVEPKVWRCSCGSFERGPRGDGAIVCDGCSEVVGTVRELAPGVTETRCIGATGAVETAIGRDPSSPAVDMDITEQCPHCPGRILRRRGDVWSCAECKREVTA